MYWTVLYWLLLMIIYSHHAYSKLQRKQLRKNLEQSPLSDNDILDLELEAQDLPEAEAVRPGHTLLQPSLDMLMSAVKFPEKQDQMLVYGNLANLGITYGKTNNRVLYTGFRKVNDILNTLLRPTRNNGWRKPIMVYIRRKPHRFKNMESDYGKKVSEEENNASEILDDEQLFGKTNDIKDFRRKVKVHKYRERGSSESSESDFSSSSGSSDYERNPGNPYTVFKDKYVQNWMWNHVMDGDHMNINPYAPQFNSMGPSGAALFFNRKWWYYNQDDYRPFD